MRRLLKPEEYLILYVIDEAEQEAQLMGEEPRELRVDEVISRINNMQVERKIEVLCAYYGMNRDEVLEHYYDSL